MQHFFENVLICASQGVPEKLVSKVPPWDLDVLTPFQTDYLANFKTERYTIDLEEGFEKARELMEKEIEKLIRKDIGGDHQRITWKHIKLPRHHLQAHPTADLAGLLPLSGRQLPDFGERPHGQSGRRSALELDEDRSSYRLDSGARGGGVVGV